jgi:hypothetical protein
VTKTHDYPMMLYRFAADAEEIDGVPCETRIVESAEDESAAKSDDFTNSPAEAAKASKGKTAPAPKATDG